MNNGETGASACLLFHCACASCLLAGFESATRFPGRQGKVGSPPERTADMADIQVTYNALGVRELPPDWTGRVGPYPGTGAQPARVPGLTVEVADLEPGAGGQRAPGLVARQRPIDLTRGPGTRWKPRSMIDEPGVLRLSAAPEPLHHGRGVDAGGSTGGRSDQRGTSSGASSLSAHNGTRVDQDVTWYRPSPAYPRGRSRVQARILVHWPPKPEGTGEGTEQFLRLSGRVGQ